MGPGPVIYYDGYCNLCSRVVRWVIRNDRRKRFRLVPLPGMRPEQAAGKEAGEETVILEVDGRRYERSSAAIRIATGLRFPWSLLGVLLVIPRFLRDPVYRWVARHRTRWFGRRETCYLPPPEEG